VSRPVIHVVQKPTHAEAREVRPRAHPLDVGPDGGLLVVGHEEREAAGVGTAGFVQRRVDVVLVA
jgi:hypothetical protein